MKKNSLIGMVVVGIIIVSGIVGSLTSKNFILYDGVLSSFGYWPAMTVLALAIAIACGYMLFYLPAQKRNRIYEMIGIILSSILELVFLIESGAYVLSRYGLGMIIGIVIITMLYSVILWGIAEITSRCRIIHIKRFLASR